MEPETQLARAWTPTRAEPLREARGLGLAAQSTPISINTNSPPALQRSGTMLLYLGPLICHSELMAGGAAGGVDGALTPVIWG